MYQRILVATGGSPWSDTAVAYAIRLAARIGAELRMVTVVPFPVVDPMTDTVLIVDALMDSIEQEAKARLIKAASQATWAGVAYETRLAWGGNIAETILRLAEEEACEAIVLGSRGMSGWKRLRLGSISNTVAAKARQPVLIVKHGAPLAPEALVWRRILVATGGSLWSEAAVTHAVRLAQAYQSEIYLLHVTPSRPARSMAAVSAEGERILTLAAARAIAVGVPVHPRLASGDVVGAILDTAAVARCDGIVLGSRGLTGWKRLMLGSISNAVAATAPQPVLVVKRFTGA